MFVVVYLQKNHGYDFGVSHPGWRGKFLNIDWGREVPINIEQDSDFNINCGFNYSKKNGSIMQLARVKLVIQILCLRS